MKEPKVGVSVIVRKQGRILLGRRKGSHGDGTWSFPGGHLKPGETIIGCALREVSEETGLGLNINSLRTTKLTEDFFLDEGLHYLTIFVCAETSGEPELREPDKCHGWDWFYAQDFPKPLFLPVENLLKDGYRI